MSNCSNCYNGCTEIVSDRCVKYTGIDVPVLGIQTGDSLSFVEQALITFLVSTLDGTGVKIDLTGIDICALVQKYLPTCGDLSIVDISKALIQAACDLQEQVDIIVADIVEINDQLDIIQADYTVRCLTVVTPSIRPSSGTHAILQATIDTLCALLLDVNTNYVRYNELDQLIQDYLDTTSSGLISNKMVPYAIIPFFPPSSTFISTNFDAAGAGIGDWNKIYLCNGNAAPDLRGRALTGVINGVPGPTLNPVVDPTVSAANPNYSLGDTAGANQITLGPTQIPLHTHANVLNFNDPTHIHYVGPDGKGVLGPLASSSTTYKFDNANSNDTPLQSTFATNPASTGITASITNVAGPAGGGLPHANIQPVVACYYIQYRP
jgi:microcystin-dependent protein